MKIKQKKAVKLPELIKWAWENDKDETFYSFTHDSADVRISRNAVDTTVGGRKPCDEAEFFIEEEVEIDEDTKLDALVIVNDKNMYISYDNFSIKNRLDSLHHAYNGTKFIYLQNEDGSIGDLIWKDGKMVE